MAAVPRDSWGHKIPEQGKELSILGVVRALDVFCAENSHCLLHPSCDRDIHERRWARLLRALATSCEKPAQECSTKKTLSHVLLSRPPLLSPPVPCQLSSRGRRPCAIFHEVANALGTVPSPCRAPQPGPWGVAGEGGRVATRDGGRKVQSLTARGWRCVGRHATTPGEGR